MKCEICGKETNVSTDGGVALMMAFCIRHNTNLLNNSFCKECAEVLVIPHIKALSNATGIEIGGIEEEENE